MSKRVLLIIIFIIVILGLFSFCIICNREIPIDNSGFTLVDDMTVEVYDDIVISSKINSISGSIIEDSKIDSNKIGKQIIEFIYKNEKGKKRRGSVEVEVVDTIKPIILLSDSYTVTVGSTTNLLDVILSADNYDSNPIREIIGEYDVNQIGSYSLTYKVTDSSGNVGFQDFTLYVKEKSSGTSYSPTYTQFEDVVTLYKTDITEIGIDVSKWQGEINFDALKSAGVEFMMIRIGSGLGFGEDSIVDPYFKRNIEEAKRVGIPVGIYYYSYATTKEEAKQQALWVIEQLKNYEIDLPIAFDWESWSYFNSLNLSLHDINVVASTFLDEIELAGYKGILYGSKYYLQNIWDTTEPVWLAHYTSKTNYDGDYTIWQLCENGKVEGINGAVDINVLYREK